MKNMIIIFGLIFSLAAGTLLAQDATKKTLPATKKTLPKNVEKKTPKKVMKQESMTGIIVSFDDLVMKGETTLTKEDAMKLAQSGGMLAFLVGSPADGKLYLVCNKKGMVENEKLAEYAGSVVEMEGKAEEKNGVAVIVPNLIKVPKE